MTPIESRVADVAIIGAGLCGLALARALYAQDVAVVVVEARERVGGRALTPTLLAPFEGWNRELLSAALAFNNTSCALSNFPDEHQPDAALQRAIALDLAAAWREFALGLNARLVHACPDIDRAAVPT